MRVIDLLNELRENIPFVQDENLSFLDNVKENHKHFLDKLKDVDEDDLNRLFKGMEGKLTKRKLINRVKTITSQLETVIEKYYNGLPSLAYIEFKRLLMNKSFIKDLSEGSYHQYLSHFFITEPKTVDFFRIRGIDLKLTPTPEAKDLFHVPFAERRKIGSYRFSVPGYPCLYLGRSLNLCIIEVNTDKPLIYASRFVVPIDITNDQIKLLNLTRPKLFTVEIYSIEDKHRYTKGQAIAFLLTFPLIQICLYKVKDSCSNEKFKHEYIIPQLLLQLVKQEESWFNSIIYTSTKKTNNMTEEEAHDLVIPTFKPASTGYCPELISKTKLTKPIALNGTSIEELHDAEERLKQMPATYLSLS